MIWTPDGDTKDEANVHAVALVVALLADWCQLGSAISSRRSSRALFSYEKISDLDTIVFLFLFD